MTWFFLGAVTVFIAAVLVFARFRRVPSEAGAYASKKPLSDPEQTLYWRLREAMPECVILSQVSFSRFIKPGVTVASRRRLFNQIAQKTVDFLVCLPDFTLVAAVELDDGTHQRTRDAHRDSILRSADVPLVRLHVRDIPSVEQLRAMFLK